jgi:hypothetical protein
MLSLWFATGILAQSETTEPPVPPADGGGGGSFAANLRGPRTKLPRKKRIREEAEALFLVSAI